MNKNAQCVGSHAGTSNTKDRVRPGAGWRRLGGSVAEHCCGTRVHCNGLIRFADGSLLFTGKWPLLRDLALAIECNSGNQMRGLMALAQRLSNAHSQHPNEAGQVSYGPR